MSKLAWTAAIKIPALQQAAVDCCPSRAHAVSVASSLLGDVKPSGIWIIVPNLSVWWLPVSMTSPQKEPPHGAYRHRHDSSITPTCCSTSHHRRYNHHQQPQQASGTPLCAKRLGQIGSRMGDEERECESLISSVFILRQQMMSSCGRALAAGMEASTWAHL